jgi:shikimate dehydrogenase
MRLFGLIGYPLTHSFSAKYFTAKFEKEEITGCLYELFPLRTIDELSFLLRDQPGLEGFNITVPYKKQVMRFLDESRVPDGLDACNCVNINGGKLIGYNTDITGFEISLKPLLRAHHKKALILGNGGAALAVAFVLRKLGIGFTIVSRSPETGTMLGYGALNKTVIRDHTVIINTTPVGTYPGENNCPGIPYQFITDGHLLYDLVYNPAKTLFLEKGEEKGAAIKNGEEMLVLQAEESWRIWNQ